MALTEYYVRADAPGGGNGSTDSNSGGNAAFTLAEAITHSGSNTNVRYNVKAGTYANTTTNRTFSGIGTTTAPIVWRGFAVTAGDLDNDASTSKPLISFTTGRATISGAHQTFQNLSFLSAATGGPTLSVTATNCKLERIRCENTGANANSRAMTTATTVCVDCWFKSGSTPSEVVTSSSQATFIRCIWEGGGAGITVSGTNPIILQDCVFQSLASYGVVLSSTGNVQILNCTFSACGGDGIRMTGVPANGIITKCVFRNITGYGINNATGGNINTVHRSRNYYYGNSSGTETGFGDSPAAADTNEASDPITSNTNMTLVSGAAARGASSLMEAQTYTSYRDGGAVQHQDSGGGGPVRTGMRGNFVNG